MLQHDLKSTMNFGLENHYSAETIRNHSGAKEKPFLLETTLKKERKKTKEIRNMGLRRGAWEHDVCSVVTWGRPLINFVVGILRLTRQ